LHLCNFSAAPAFVYDRRMSEVSAFVLAGGQSARMGTDKAFLEFEGQPLISRALALAKTVVSDVRILGSPEKFRAYAMVVEDEFPNHGPLGGIHAALRCSTADLNLILAVDMPFVETRFLKYLLDQANRHSAMVTVPRAGGGWQPLCSVYRRPFADLAQTALEQGHNKIDPLFDRTEICVIEEHDLEREGFSAEMFRNLNTPEDVRHAARYAGGSQRTASN
jgi:molybdopterin-guanine dinucleotide biosynthesis protein A